MNQNSSLLSPKASYSDGVSKFTTVLRMISGQDTEPDFVLVEHAYARPWNWQLDNSNSRPCKTLFLRKISKTERDDYIDVESEFSTSNIIPLDLAKGKHLMKECERHVMFAKLNTVRSGINKEEEAQDDDDCDWEEKINKSGWSESQISLFNRVVKILDSDRLSRLTLVNAVNEPIKRRALIDKTAAKFRQTLGRISWDLKLTQWLHNILIQNLNTHYLAAYLDILQTLKSKIPNLVDKMIALPSTHKGPNVEALNLLLKRPWDPVLPLLNEEKPCKLENFPIMIQVPSGLTPKNVPQTSRRFRFFNSQLQRLVKFIPVSFTSEVSDPESVLEQLMMEVQRKVVECKVQHPMHPIVLLGWGIGALLSCYVSLVEKVSANICLGLPLEDHMGKRGGPDDPLLEMITPTLFLMGEKATNSTVDDMESFRGKVKAETSMVVIAGADNLLRMSLEKRYWDGLTQSMVDKCIVDEIGDFLMKTFSEDTNNNPPGTSHPISSGPLSSGIQTSSFTNPSVPGYIGKTNKKDFPSQRKRKMSSSLSLAESSLTSSQPPSKLMRTAGTAISQTLGLKIPVGVSSVASLMKQDSKTFSAIHLGEGEKYQILENEGSESLQKGKATSKSNEISQQRLKQTVGTKVAEALSTVKLNPSSSASTSSSVLSVCGNMAPIASIPLGSLASLTRQKYQQMIQNSEAMDFSCNDLPSGSNDSNFVWRGKGPKTVDSDLPKESNVVDVSNYGSGASVPRGASNSVSTRNSKPGNGNETTKVLDMQDESYQTTSKPHGGGRRGRPPGRPRGSTSSSKGRGRSSGTSTAVLTLTGSSSGDGSGVESAGRGISSLGRGLLTLSKGGGTSTVRVYSASGQKSWLVSSSSSVTSNATPSQSVSQKPRGFYLTNISSSTSSRNPGTGIVTLAGKMNTSIASSRTASIDSVRRLSNSATTSSTSPPVSQVSLNLQGISASRAVSFGSAMPSIMLVSSNVTSSTNTTTTVSSGGLKTTKSIVGVKPSVEAIKPSTEFDQGEASLNEVKIADSENIQVTEDGLLTLRDASIASTASGKCDKDDENLDVIKLISDLDTKSNVPQHTEALTDSTKAILVQKPQKTLVLGTKVVPSTSKIQGMKSNITFIRSKTLNKVFTNNTDNLSKSLLKTGSDSTASQKTCLKKIPTSSYLKIPAKNSSIRLVRSLSSANSTLKISSSQTVGNIVTKTFTISSNSVKGSTKKRRISLESDIKPVAKRSRGTSTDQVTSHELDVESDVKVSKLDLISSVIGGGVSDVGRISHAFFHDGPETNSTNKLEKLESVNTDINAPSGIEKETSDVFTSIKEIPLMDIMQEEPKASSNIFEKVGNDYIVNEIEKLQVSPETAELPGTSSKNENIHCTNELLTSLKSPDSAIPPARSIHRISKAKAVIGSENKPKNIFKVSAMETSKETVTPCEDSKIKQSKTSSSLSSSSRTQVLNIPKSSVGSSISSSQGPCEVDAESKSGGELNKANLNSEQDDISSPKSEEITSNVLEFSQDKINTKPASGDQNSPNPPEFIEDIALPLVSNLDEKPEVKYEHEVCKSLLVEHFYKSETQKTKANEMTTTNSDLKREIKNTKSEKPSDDSSCKVEDKDFSPDEDIKNESDSSILSKSILQNKEKTKRSDKRYCKVQLESVDSKIDCTLSHGKRISDKEVEVEKKPNKNGRTVEKESYNIGSSSVDKSENIGDVVKKKCEGKKGVSKKKSTSEGDKEPAENEANKTLNKKDKFGSKKEPITGLGKQGSKKDSTNDAKKCNKKDVLNEGKNVNKKELVVLVNELVQIEPVSKEKKAAKKESSDENDDKVTKKESTSEDKTSDKKELVKGEQRINKRNWEEGKKSSKIGSGNPDATLNERESLEEYRFGENKSAVGKGEVKVTYRKSSTGDEAKRREHENFHRKPTKHESTERTANFFSKESSNEEIKKRKREDLTGRSEATTNKEGSQSKKEKVIPSSSQKTDSKPRIGLIESQRPKKESFMSGKTSEALSSKGRESPTTSSSSDKSKKDSSTNRITRSTVKKKRRLRSSI